MSINDDTDLYGKTNVVSGLFHVATRFANFWIFPIVPLESCVVFGDEYSGFRCYPIGLSLKSILLTYARIVLAIAAIVFMTITAYRASSGDPWLSAALSLTGLIVVLICTFIPYFQKASFDRACELALIVGLPEEVFDGLKVKYGRISSQHEAEEIDRRLRGKSAIVNEKTQPGRAGGLTLLPAAWMQTIRSDTDTKRRGIQWVFGNALGIVAAVILTLGGFYTFWAETGFYAWLGLLELKVLGHTSFLLTVMLAYFGYGVFFFQVFFLVRRALSRLCDPIYSMIMAVPFTSLIILLLLIWSLISAPLGTLDANAAIERAGWIPRRVTIESTLWNVLRADEGVGISRRSSSRNSEVSQIYLPLRTVPNSNNKWAYFKTGKSRFQSLSTDALLEPID